MFVGGEGDTTGLKDTQLVDLSSTKTCDNLADYPLGIHDATGALVSGGKTSIQEPKSVTTIPGALDTVPAWAQTVVVSPGSNWLVVLVFPTASVYVTDNGIGVTSL